MYKHIVGTANFEVIINKSKFIGNASFVQNEDEAKAFVEKIRKEHAAATHSCFAYVCDTLGNLMRFSDDGEPQGTAGMPILEVIRNKKLVQTAVVVTRYFGGIKLGVGGLVRAYTNCAAGALDVGNIATECPSVFFAIICEYTLFKPVEILIKSLENVVSINVEYSDMVKISLVAKVELFDEICVKIANLTNGKAEVIKGKTDFYPFSE